MQSVKQTRIFEKTRDLSAQQRDLVDEGYKAGNTELTRLNEAQRDLVEAETNLASSYINIQNAKAQLDAAVAANSAAYYGDPEHVAPGEIKNTPSAEESVAAEKPEPMVESGLKAPADQSKIPPANPNTVVVEPSVKAPEIPADPTRVPEKK